MAIKVKGKTYRNLQEQVLKNMEDIDEIKKSLPYPSNEYYNKEEANEKFETKAAAFSGDYEDLTNKPELAEVATTGSYDDLTDKPAYFVYSLSIYCADGDEGYEFDPIFQTIPTTADLGNINDHPDYADIVDYLFLKQVGYDDYNDQVCSIAYLSTTELGLRRYDGSVYDEYAQVDHIHVTILDKKMIA